MDAALVASAGFGSILGGAESYAKFWPPVFAAEQGVGPPMGWDVGQEIGLDSQPGVFPLSDRFAEMDGTPVNDDGSEQVEPGHAVVLAFARAVANFALAPDFTEGDGQFVLARIGRKLSQPLARRKGATGQGGSNPQDIRPVPHDHVLPDFVAGQSNQGFLNASGLEDMQPFDSRAGMRGMNR